MPLEIEITERNELETELWLALVREKQGPHAKNVVFSSPTSEVLRPKSSNLTVGMDFANKVVSSCGGIGL